jgi:hypothetical protein
MVALTACSPSWLDLSLLIDVVGSKLREAAAVMS